jgi:hypothetical protein
MTAKTSDAQKVVEKYDGWQLTHEAAPRSVNTGHGTFLVEEGQFIASKRVDLTVHDVFASSPEQLADRIEAYEQARPDPNATPVGPTEEQLLNSAKATLGTLVTAGARPSVDVDLTPAKEKATPKAVNLSVPPVIEETKLDKEDAALVAAVGGEKKLEGVGSGTAPGP